MYEKISIILSLNPNVIEDEEGVAYFEEMMEYFARENLAELFEEEVGEVCSVHVMPYKANMALLEGDTCVDTSDMKKRVKKALQCLKDNGIEEDECETVLQALGYILMDRELEPYYEEEDCLA